MKRVYVKCAYCHHVFRVENAEHVDVLVQILIDDVKYSCKSCGAIMDFYAVHVCSRVMGSACDVCEFRFLCFTENAT